MVAANATRDLQRLQLRVGGMQCSFCVSSVEKALHRMAGVERVAVNLAHEEALVDYRRGEVSPDSIRATLRALGYRVLDPDRVAAFEQEAAELRAWRHRLVAAAGLVAAGLAVMAAMWLGHGQPWLRPLMLVLALTMVFGVARRILAMAWAAVRRRILNQHVLMACGAFAGLAGGVIGLFDPSWPAPDFLGAAVLISAYHVLSAYVALVVKARSAAAIRRLMELQPPTARVVRDGAEQEVAVDAVVVGDRVRVRPGERLPADGVVVDGDAAVDEGMVTGESVPVDKVEGAGVIGGSINRTGTLLVRVTQVGASSYLQQVVRATEAARALKPNVVQLVDHVLAWFVPAVLVAAALAFVTWTLGAWLVVGAADSGRAVFATLAVLVLGYPCAIGMATPLAMLRGGGIAAQHGIFVRAGEAFQVLKDIDRVVLDKTGTLTLGRPRVMGVEAAPGQSEDRVRILAAALERHSEHPLARAIVDHARALGLPEREPEGFEALAGRGVRGRVDGQSVRVGGPRRVAAAAGIDPSPVAAAIDRAEAAGQTAVAVVADRAVVGLITLADALKDDAADTVTRLRRAGLAPVLLSGDNERAAAAVAAQAGIADVLAPVLPDDKAERIRRLQQRGHRVAMVGDGVNDAPALTQADVGIAIGAGTDIAIDAADVVVVGRRLGAVADAFVIGRRSHRKTVQNVALAFAFNGVGVPAAMTGLVHPVWAMAAMAASVTTVLANSFAGALVPRRRAVGADRERRETLTLAVPTMRCAGCVEAVRKAVDAVPGAAVVSGDVEAKQVQVALDRARADRAAVADAIRGSGHVAE